MSSLKLLLHEFMTMCHVRELMQNKNEFQQEESQLEDAMPPEIPLRSQLSILSPNILQNLTRSSDLSTVKYLNLFNNALRKIDSLDGMTSLEVLVLSFNQISELLPDCLPKSLKRLDLNHNFLRTVEGISFEHLEQLDLRHNWISEISQVELLQK